MKSISRRTPSDSSVKSGWFCTVRIPRYGLFQSAPQRLFCFCAVCKHAAVRRGAVELSIMVPTSIQQQTGVSSAHIYSSLISSVCAPKVPDKRCDILRFRKVLLQLLILQNRIRTEITLKNDLKQNSPESMSAHLQILPAGSRFLDHIWKKIEHTCNIPAGPTYTLATGLISKCTSDPTLRAPVTARNIVCIK